MIKRLWFLPGVLVMIVFLAGCVGNDGGNDVDPNLYTLTIGVEGEGTVTPSEGAHRYEQNAVIALKATASEGWQFKEWVGAVADTGSEETAINMNGDQKIKAVFVTAPSSSINDGKPALWRLKQAGEGFTAEAEAWNCLGLEGEWRGRGIIAITGYGSISGDWSFTMPPRPDSGPWLSPPFSYTISGTLDAEGAKVKINYIYENIVTEFFENHDGLMMAVIREGEGTAVVEVTTPDGATFVVSRTYFAPSSAEPGAIIFERHSECN